MTGSRDWRRRSLDILLFLLTIGLVVAPFWERIPEWLQLSFLVVFVALFALRWRIDEDSRGYIRSNWFDLVFVVLLASPVLRLFTAFRVVKILPALKLGVLLRANRRRILKLVLLSRDSFPIAMALIFGMVFMFGIITFLLEHGRNPSFSTIHDGLWWAFVTLTTVGYGDIVPLTDAGRIVAAMLMVFGVAVYSLMVANLTHFLETIDRSDAPDRIGKAVIDVRQEALSDEPAATSATGPVNRP